jgi:hypothetical protein
MRKSCFFVEYLVTIQQIPRNLLSLIKLGRKQYNNNLSGDVYFPIFQWCTINYVALLHLLHDQTLFVFAASFSKRIHRLPNYPYNSFNNFKHQSNLISTIS